MDDKLIVSNRGALLLKYGKAGLRKIEAAVTQLKAADAKRGIKTKLIYLDVNADMKPFGGKTVTSPGSARQNKLAIDSLFSADGPDYLMILGARDVVPHQDMVNPLYHATDDPDLLADGDLPYCCDAGYSTDIAKFKGPTRVVGRLPDLHGGDDAAYLVKLLKLAAAHVSHPPEAYAKYFGLSAFSWRKSTQLSLFNVFGDSSALKLSPSSGPSHSASALAPLSHFINCHGGSSDPRFYGEKSKKLSNALTSKGLAGKLSRGTVAAAECCYGAELYDCTPVLNMPVPICHQYLDQGAYGYFGSTTIAYGPAVSNGQADLVTQYFMLAVLEGASLGRAALIARQKFLEQTNEMDPVDLKTLAQFILLGDPSIHPVAVASPTKVPKSLKNSAGSDKLQRSDRRAQLQVKGDLLKRTKPTASVRSGHRSRSASVLKVLATIAREEGVDKQAFAAFDVEAPAAARAGQAKGAAVASRYYIAGSGFNNGNPAPSGRMVVAREVGGAIVGWRVYHAK